jgi:amino-acid N-acetyltransferase
MEGKLRRPRLDDVPAIQRLVNRFAENGEMLPRALSDIYENVRDYLIAEEDGELRGCCALHVMWDDLAEIKSLAVREDCRGTGLGRSLVQACIEEASELGVPRVFVLTYIPSFFEQFGFSQVEKADLPQKVWMECIHCPKFPDCGEVGMLLDLRRKA